MANIGGRCVMMLIGDTSSSWCLELVVSGDGGPSAVGSRQSRVFTSPAKSGAVPLLMLYLPPNTL